MTLAGVAQPLLESRPLVPAGAGSTGGHAGGLGHLGAVARDNWNRVSTGRLCAMMDEVAQVGLYARVVGQDKAIAALKAAAVRPVHAYLFVGPPGTGKAVAAVGFAAALLCPNVPGGDGTCETCRRVLAGVHPDVITVERVGAAINIDTARETTLMAATSPLEASRKVLILNDFHLVQAAGPALLKTIEEPPGSTVFVVLAEFVPPELITIASRCVRVDFDALRPEQVAAALIAEGVDAKRAAELADASGGRLDRARLLASDRGFEDRRRAWQSIPSRLDGTGATAAMLADELLGLLESSVEPLRSRHDTERVALDDRNTRAAQITGRGGARAGGRAARSMLTAGVSELEERQRREVRRQRTDELRAGLAILAGAYRDRLVESARVGAGRIEPSAGEVRRRKANLEALEHIERLARDLQYNPAETIQVQALLTRLGRAAIQT
jgi:DNA polymerase III subunit delta'